MTDRVDAKEGSWGLTWVGGILYYDSREAAERARYAAGLGEVIPPRLPPGADGGGS